MSYEKYHQTRRALDRVEEVVDKSKIIAQLQQIMIEEWQQGANGLFYPKLPSQEQVEAYPQWNIYEPKMEASILAYWPVLIPRKRPEMTMVGFRSVGILTRTKRLDEGNNLEMSITAIDRLDRQIHYVRFGEHRGEIVAPESLRIEINDRELAGEEISNQVGEIIGRVNGLIKSRVAGFPLEREVAVARGQIKKEIFEGRLPILYLPYAIGFNYLPKSRGET